MDIQEAKPTDPLRQNILEAVDCLRQRKCRPDRESIAHYVLRKFGSTMNEIFAELENIVDEGGLIKVEYKGTTSYRSPSSFDTKNSPLLTKHSKILNSSKTTRLIITGVNELLAKDPNYAQIGVPLDELKVKLFEFDTSRFNNDTIDVLLERETNVGSIFVAKSDLLQESMRIFPKDLPVPEDMKIVSLGSDFVEKEEKKPKKPRKNSLPLLGDLDGSGVPEPKKARKSKIKEEPIDINDLNSVEAEQVFAVKSAPSEFALAVSEPTEDFPSHAKKNTKTNTLGRRLIAEKVAQVIRKTYESTTAFETTSAQMIKLAEAVVSRQGDEAPKVPTLILAGGASSPGRCEESDIITPAIEKSSKTMNELSGDENSKTNATVKNEKSQENEIESPKESENSPSSTNKSPIAEGLTRSKRDKRKKQVFDPSDLPNSYSTYATKTVKKPRLSSEPSLKQIAAKANVKKSISADIKKEKLPIPTIPKKCTGKKVQPKKKNISLTNNIKQEAISEDETSQLDHSPDVEEEEQRSSSSNGKKIQNQNSSLTHDAKTELHDVCDYCADSPKKVKEEVLFCSSCHTSVHPSCMGYSPELAQRILEFCKRDGNRKFRWQCVDCKTCEACKGKIVCGSTPSPKNGTSNQPESNPDDGNSDVLKVLLCEYCDAGYHRKCTQEDIQNDDDADAWICPICKASKTAEIENNGDTTTVRKEQSSSKPEDVKSEFLKQKKQDPTKLAELSLTEIEAIDIRSWSISDVERYFSIKGLKDEAITLRNQEVDGCSLLLLQREDIINKMGFRLGPALKVYRLIFELQSKAPVRSTSRWRFEESKLGNSKNPPIIETNKKSITKN